MFSMFRKPEDGQESSRGEILVGRKMTAEGAALHALDDLSAPTPPTSRLDGALTSEGLELTEHVEPASSEDDLDASEHDPGSALASESGESSHSDSSGESGDWIEELASHFPARRRRPARGKRLEKASESGDKRAFTASQRLLLLDAWRRSGLPAGDFAGLVGISKHTLYKWNQQFEQLGPEGLMDQPRGAKRGSRLSEVTKRAILMLKQSHPDWGCQRISDMLLRGPALPASASSVARVLHEAGYETVEEPTRAHPDKVRRFERAKPNQLWQTDLFTFMLKRQNRRVYLVAFMDDHSRYITAYGLHASASTAMVIETLEAGINSYGPPEEILTDNGPQYVTWRGKSQFSKRLEQHGIRQIVARPRRPQTLGKIERFWGTLWREFLEAAVFLDLADARTRIGLFIDHHNFQRAHQGIDGLVPADRFFGAATEVARTLKERVAANSLELARHGEPRAPFYVTGQLDGQSFSVHAEGSRFILTRPGETRREVELTAPRAEQDPVAADEGPEREYPLPEPVCPVAASTSEGAEPSEDKPRDDRPCELPGGDA